MHYDDDSVTWAREMLEFWGKRKKGRKVFGD